MAMVSFGFGFGLALEGGELSWHVEIIRQRVNPARAQRSFLRKEIFIIVIIFIVVHVPELEALHDWTLLSSTVNFISMGRQQTSQSSIYCCRASLKSRSIEIFSPQQGQAKRLSISSMMMAQAQCACGLLAVKAVNFFDDPVDIFRIHIIIQGHADNALADRVGLLH